MGILDQFMNLKSKGVSNQEIVRILQEQGVSPGEISEAFGRAQIKSAVSNMGTEGMEHSILGSEEEEPERLPLGGLEGETLSDIDLTPPTPGRLAPIPQNVTKEISQEAQEMYNPQEAGDYYQPQQYQQNQEYAPQEGYQYQVVAAGLDTDTMIEVSEQVFMEKNKPLQKKLDEMSEFRAITQTKIDNISDRLRKIEAIIDRLQASILEKVGGYGHGLETVRKELGMMQDSFAKVVNQVAEKSEEKYHARSQQHLNNQQPNLQSGQGYKNHSPAVNRSSKKAVRKRSGKR
jgi:hypothetical protein